MRKVIKSFALSLFLFMGSFAGAKLVNDNKLKTSNQNNDVLNQNIQKKYVNNYVYNLKPGEGFNPNSPKFNDYWNELTLFAGDNLYLNESYDGYWLMAVNDVELVNDNYQISFYYSFYSDTWENEQFDTQLKIYNENGSNAYNLNLPQIKNDKSNYEYVTISVPINTISDGGRLVFDINFIYNNFRNFHFQVYGEHESKFDLINYPYLDEFYINSFSFINDSITDTSFEFLIDARLSGTNTILPYPNNLTLYSNGVPLNTQFESYQGNLLKYKVTNLTPNSTYTNFSISISEYSEIKLINGYTINTKTPKIINSSAGLIAGSVIGGLILLLLIALIIVLILRKRKKVIEYNYYHNYRTFIDPYGNYVKMNQAEYDALDKEVTAQYQEVDDSTTELLDGHYEFTPKNN